MNFSRFSAFSAITGPAERKKFAPDAPFSDNFRVFTRSGGACRSRGLRNMTDAALHEDVGTGTIAVRPSLDRAFDPRTIIIFLGLLGAGLLFVAYSLYADVDASGARTTTFLPYLLLFVALLIALGFEFVNGFHDTANAVATVIYTHSLPAQIAVEWSGCFNFLGVLLSSGGRRIRHHLAVAG